MQAFIFISGFLTTENSTKIINACKLLILYYLFNFTFSIILYFYIDNRINFLYPQYSYWYILSLFYWRISIKYLNNIKFIFIISIVISLLEGYWNCFSHILSIDKTIILFPYFLAGYKLKKMNIINKFILWKKGIFKFIIFLSCLILYSYIVYIYIKDNDITNYTLLMNIYNKNNNIKERIILFIISSIMIFLILLILPNMKIPLINKWGKNSLYIYLFHRIFTIITQKNLFSQKKYSDHIVELSIIFSLIISFIFGSDLLNKFLNSILNNIYKNIIEYKIKGKIICNFLCFSFIFMLFIKPITILYNNNGDSKEIKKKYKYNRKNLSFNREEIELNENFEESLSNSIRISYIGDLILLKNQVIAAKNNITGKYEFDDIFQFTSSHFHESDLTIGVYEGPSAGNETSFSNGNYNDGIPLFLNFPDEFAEAVKKAGINLVTTANNHLLDKRLKGAMRTLDILDKYNIEHVGSYRNYEEQNQIKIINVKGIKIAVLAYTSIINAYKIDNLYEKYNFLTNIIPKTNNPHYNEIYQKIKINFDKAKQYNPDIIMVLAHMGIEFQHKQNEFQDKWNKIFSDLGADIILGDHSHSIQPLQYIEKTFIVNSPGNFVNSYIKKDGDSTALIDIYIHKKSKRIIGTSVIPMYTKEIRKNYFSAIPIYDLIKNNSIFLSEKEKTRIEIIQKMSTKILLGKEFDINDAKKKYFFINNTYYDFEENKTNFCKRLDRYHETNIYELIKNSSSITFIGDSITEGTKNGYHP